MEHNKDLSAQHIDKLCRDVSSGLISGITFKSLPGGTLSVFNPDDGYIYTDIDCYRQISPECLRADDVLELATPGVLIGLWYNRALGTITVSLSHHTDSQNVARKYCKETQQQGFFDCAAQSFSPA